MPANTITVRLRCRDAYDAFNETYGGYESVDLYDLVFCGLGFKEEFEYLNRNPSAILNPDNPSPWPEGLSKKHFVKKVSKLDTLNDIELDELRARGVEVIVESL